MMCEKIKCNILPTDVSVSTFDGKKRVLLYETPRTILLNPLYGDWCPRNVGSMQMWSSYLLQLD